MKFGLLVYWNRVKNIGEYTQSIATRGHLDECSTTYINKEQLHKVEGENIPIILNGWFTNRPENWPPSSSISPLFISFHISPKVEDRLLTEETVAYLKLHEPIGCRDHYTEELLKERGVDAYFSGCLTLTLSKDKFIDTTIKNDILIVDPFYKYDKFSMDKDAKAILHNLFWSPYFIWLKLKQSLKERKLKRSLSHRSIKELKQLANQNHLSHDERFNLSEKFLAEIANSKLVITSRLHTVLPALAMGVPVVFLNINLNYAMDRSRLSSYIDGGFAHTINELQFSQSDRDQLRTLIEEIEQRGNPTKHLEIAKSLSLKVKEFISSLS